MTPARRSEAITFRGPPRKVSAIVQLGALTRGVLPVTLKLPAETTVFRARVSPFGREASEVRLRLPRETPPGTYKGKAPVAGKNRDIVVEVESVVRLRAHPARTVLSAKPGSKAEFSVTLLNVGNVPCEVPKSGEFDLDEVGAPDRALGRALRAKLGEGESRVERLFEDLRASHGGEARLAVTGGAGVLEPGESRELSSQLEVPASVQSGRVYSGTWQIANVAHRIIVEVKKSSRAPRRGRIKG